MQDLKEYLQRKVDSYLKWQENWNPVDMVRIEVYKEILGIVTRTLEQQDEREELCEAGRRGDDSSGSMGEAREDQLGRDEVPPEDGVEPEGCTGDATEEVPEGTCTE